MKFLKNMWDGMQPKTRMVFLVVFFVCLTAIVLALIFTGQLGVVAELFK